MFNALAFFLAASAPSEPIVVDGQLCHPRNLMLKYESPEVLGGLGKLGRVIRVFPQIGYAVLESKPNSLRATRYRLRSWPGIERVNLDRAAQPAYEPNDDLWPLQWHMKAIRTDFAWDITKGNPSVVVAVIDTGVNVAHPDLASNIWVNPGEVPGNGLDDDHNGYVDDVNGYDFAYGDSNPDDVNGHGTACSGIVAAIQDNTIGVSGAAPSSKVMALKAALDNGFFYDSANVPAYLYAADNGAKVLSMSFFSDRVSPAERAAIDYCWNNGVVPIASAGNSASVYPYYPAAYENVIAVAAVGSNLNKASFSNYGSWVDVSAPGTGVITTTRSGSYTNSFAGTSAACPHVAGVAALCFAMNLNATSQTVRAAIEDTATLQTQPPFGEFSNYGLVNAEAAVQRMVGGPDSAHPPVVRYVTEYLQNLSRTHDRALARIYGRGFGAPNTVEILSDGVPIGYVARSRDWVDFEAWKTPLNVQVRVNGNVIANLTYANTSTISNLIADASTQSATLSGSFWEALNVDDQYIRCTRRSDGSILVQATFRKVTPRESIRIALRRRYLGATGGTETVQLYDWSSGSYPYGNFVGIGSGACPTTYATANYVVNDAYRFVDPEGTVYLRIVTSTDLPSGTELNLDHARLDAFSPG